VVCDFAALNMTQLTPVTLEYFC